MGTVLLKGTIDNTQQLLWPLQMVKVKLILATEKCPRYSQLNYQNR